MNEKSVLVIDTPSDCIECPLQAFECCHVKRKEIPMLNITQGTKPEWCPLKPLPDYVEPIHEDDCWEKPTNSWLNGERTGWNECLDEILGENE